MTSISAPHSLARRALPVLLSLAFALLCVTTSWRESGTWDEYLLGIGTRRDVPDALFHPHPWPSAMRVLEGEYEMAVGFGAGAATPPVAALMVTKGDFRYEMTHPDSWHYVRPLAGPTLSLMVAMAVQAAEAAGLYRRAAAG